MICINLLSEDPLSLSCGVVPLSLMKAVSDLSAEEPETKRITIVYLRSCIERGADISPALSFIEKELFNEDHGVRKQALETLRAYALSVYKVDITSAMTDFLEADGHDVDYPLTTKVVSTALVPVSRKTAEQENGWTYRAKQRSVIRLHYTHNTSPIPLSHGLEDERIEQISEYQEGVTADTIGLPSGRINDVNMASAIKVNRVGRKASRSSFAAAMILAIIMIVIVSFKEASTGSSVASVMGKRNSAVPGESDGDLLETPLYLTHFDAQKQRFIDSESTVFHVLFERLRGDRDFVGRFNSLGEEQKRGFILFVRSAALSGFIGDKNRFSRKHWMSSRSKNMRTLTNDFLAASDIRDSMRKYEAIYSLAERQTRLFLSQNAWLQTFLKEQYEDLHKGLFFFFAEHSFTTEEVRTTSSRFSDIRDVIRSVSNAIISDRGGKSRISPKRGVKDSQIREIVAAAFFSELFYEVPADLITLISAYETNFSMEYWEGGFGTTQQTTRAANTVLQSDYWIDKASESAGVKIRMQLVPISALDNVFLCITEGAKTVAIKAAELEIRTRDIITMNKVKFGGKKVPALWATAFKYNGSKRYARSYAKNIQRYYQKRESWLKSFDSGPYLLFAMK